VTESQRADTSSDEARKDPGERPREPFGIAAILRTAARTGRQHVWRILAVAIVVGLAITAGEIISDNFVDPRNNALSIGGTLSVEVISLFGTVLLSGFLCKLVGAATHGGEPVAIGTVMRTLPWVKLIAADILFALVTIAGLLLVVIPGLICFNLFSMVGPAIEIERRSPFSGLCRSARLVRRRFWSVALLVSLPQFALALGESNLPDPHGALHIFEVVVLRGLVVSPVEAAFGLVLVAVAYRLIDPASAPSG
jgi:hypothetical protein